MHCCVLCQLVMPETEEFWYFHAKPGQPKKRHGSQCRVCKGALSRERGARKRRCAGCPRLACIRQERRLFERPSTARAGRRRTYEVPHSLDVQASRVTMKHTLLRRGSSGRQVLIHLCMSSQQRTWLPSAGPHRAWRQQ